jgi:hypothetical protein
MWVKVDDSFVEHPKVIAAGRHLGVHGLGRVVAVWLEALCYTARNLTDGLVPGLVARKFISDRRPLDVLEVMALPDVRLMTKEPAGFRFHDFTHYQPSAATIKDKRARDRARKTQAKGEAKPVAKGEAKLIEIRSHFDRNKIVAETRSGDEVARIPATSPDPSANRRDGFRADSSALARARSRPVLKDQDQDQDQKPPLRGLRSHLQAAAHAGLDADPAVSDSELLAQVKDAAAALRLAHRRSRVLAAVVDGVRAQRAKRPA